MNYKELIDKALKGKSVNRAAHEWGIPQSTLDKVAKGTRLPDYQTGLILAREAGIEPGEVMRICAAEEAQKKPRGMFLEYGLATVSSMLIAIMLTIAGLLAPINDAQAKTPTATAQGFEMVPFRQNKILR